MSNKSSLTPNNKPIKKNRNSALELLRIISMIMIVFHHFATHGNFIFGKNSLNIPHFWFNFILLGGKLGVNVFVLISGFFLINNKNTSLNISKILKLLGEVLIYSVTIYVFFLFIGKADFGLNSIIKAFFPITFKSWWFASTYFVLFLIHPFLNVGLHSLDKKSYQILLFLLIIICSIIPTITGYSYQSNDLVWFILLYSLASYARLYDYNSSFTSKHYFIFSIIFILLSYFICNFFTILGDKNNFIYSINMRPYEMQSITMLLSSFCLFMAFIKIKPFYNKWINIISSTTFGVYLIHDNVYIRNFLWINLFKNSQYQNSIKLIPYSIFSVICVYLICTLIDLIRQNVLEKPFMMLINKIYTNDIISKIYLFFSNVIFGK